MHVFSSYNNYRAFIWTNGLARLPRSRLPGWKFLHINTSKITTTFSHISTREIHPAYRAVSLSWPAGLPYKLGIRKTT